MIYNDVPNNNEPLTLFEYSVRKVLSLGLMGKSRSHQAWANLIFSYEKKSYVRSELMSKIKHEFTSYFDEDLQYKFLEEKIRANFSYLFGEEDEGNLFDRMLNALDAECREQRDPRNKDIYRVSDCITISSQENSNVYRTQLIVDDGDDPHFSEGMPIEFKTLTTSYSCEVIEFDYVNAVLFFSCTSKILLTKDSKVVSDATMNTIALMNLLGDIAKQNIEETVPLIKFIKQSTEYLSTVSHQSYPSYIDGILKEDKSQYEAFKAALDKDITFIWGPPGTGKSYTLASIIMALYHQKSERTAVCCLSNVAVDQLANKVVDIIEIHEPEMQRGEFYRSGRTQDEKLIKTDFLYPDDITAEILRRKIQLLTKKVEQYREKNEQYTDKAINVKAKLKDARQQLKEHTDFLISKVKVVFSTISNFVINPRLKDGEFDNLIVDEASMLALPQLIALARYVKKRIILVGDFQQLAPITIAGLPVLKTNVFRMCGIDINHTNHPALHQLLNQRRSNPKLVDIINHIFYADRLVAKNNQYSPIVARPPYSCCVVAMKSITDGLVRFTKGGTRQNPQNAKAVMDLLDLYSEQIEETFSIGIITPYTGQVAMLKALFLRKSYSLEFQDRIKIGTVHTFQGSECDVIIFDMVDSWFENDKKSYFGKIYAGEQGEQLLNVAISRARHKLIVVCNPDFLTKCPGGVVSNRTINIFNQLLKARYSKE